MSEEERINFVPIAVRCFMIAAIVLIFGASANIWARSSITVSGSTWSVDGVFSLRGHGGTTRLNVSSDLSFGPQTVDTQAGPVTLKSDEFVSLLDDELSQGLIFGTYTVSAKGKLRKLNLESAHESLKQKIITLLETTYGSQFNGTVDVSTLRLRTVLRSIKKQQTVRITFTGKASFLGDLDGAQRTAAQGRPLDYQSSGLRKKPT